MVQVPLRGLHNDLVTYLTLHAVPKICAPIQDQRIEIAQELYTYLQGIVLADDTGDRPELNIQILIGSDLYWTLVTGNIIRGPPGSNGPVVLETQVGWLLSGSLEVNNQNPKDPVVNLVSSHCLLLESEEQEQLNEQSVLEIRHTRN